MSKRSYTSMHMSSHAQNPPAKVQKTERSHEENQERAYIAASRRADRSLEARVQSAKMASDIHRKRTGRALRVTEEIVLKEEMYEEMEDDVPRCYKYLTERLQNNNSPGLNPGMTAFQAFKNNMAHYDEVNKLFNAAFPRAASFSQPADAPLYAPRTMRHSHPSPSRASATASPIGRNPSISSQSHMSSTDGIILNASASSTPTTASAPTPGLSPATTATDVAQHSFPNPPVDPQLIQQTESSYLSELSDDLNPISDVDGSDPMVTGFFGGDTQFSFCMANEYSGPAPSLHELHASDLDDLDGQGGPGICHDYLEASLSPLESQMNYPDTVPTGFCFNASGPGGWETFINFDTDP
ncbi:hypothetical protein F4802DRAFT_608820 [Xylaria palmicola]|nr:hypothetical protein F4802DRAFT_608820 [Xylaria palmicola]